MSENFNILLNNDVDIVCENLDTISINRLFSMAIMLNKTELCLLLLKDERVVPTQEMLYSISGFGNKNLVEALIKTKKVDPKFNDYESPRRAMYKGRFEIYEIYKKYGFDPYCENEIK
jgi:hypothetical protein